jgi:hypothetical protein
MENTNPLQKYYRQSQISIRLLSKGRWYSKDVVQDTETGEHPVLPMTAMDELAFRTPDSMMSGQATVDVIKSCIPTIKDPWKLVNYDIDTVLIGIRIASYGENIDVTSTVPVTNEAMTHSLNLPQLLEQLQQNTISDTFTLNNGLSIKIKPLTYKDITVTQLKTFEQQKLYAQVADSELSTEEKTTRFRDSFRALNDLNISLVVSNIESINLPTGESVTNAQQIRDFINNANSKEVKEIENGLSELRRQGTIKPISIKCTEEQIKNGAPISYDLPITFDNSNFFV